MASFKVYNLATTSWIEYLLKPATHDQAISTITGLQAILDGKATVKGRVVSDMNHADFRISGMYGINGTPTNGYGESYGGLIVAANSDVGLQIAGGYSNDDLYFRGWANNGAIYYNWRKLWHDGNLTGERSEHYHDGRYFTESEIQNDAIYMRRQLVNANGVPTSNLGSPTVAEMALFQEQFNNKTEFYDITKMTFESFNGTTWTDLSSTITDQNKKRFVGGDINATVNIPNLAVKYRITLRASSYVYLNAMYIFWSSQSHSTKVTIWRKHDSGSWEQVTSSTANVSAWPGHLYLPFPTIPWNPTATLGSHYHEVRIEFEPTWSSHATYGTYPILLQKLQLWGGYPAGKRTIYTLDENKGASFPQNVYASQLYDNSQRVYSPNNKPSITDLGALVETDQKLLFGGATQYFRLAFDVKTKAFIKHANGIEYEVYHSGIDDIDVGNSITSPLIYTNQIASDGGSIAFTGLDYLDFNGALLKEIGTPTADTDATNKAYVDGKFTNPYFSGTAGFESTPNVDGDNVWHAGNFDPTKAIPAPLISKTTSYTFTLADANKFFYMNSATAYTFTIPLNSAVAYPVGTELHMARYGTGEVSVAITYDGTIVSEGSKKRINAQYQVVTAKKIATNTWLLFGALKT